MTPSQALYDRLRQAGVDFYTSVPCKLLAEMIGLLEHERDERVFYSPVTREEEAVGIMAGAAMAGRRPALLMQNSGFGNSINAIRSLLQYYKLPALFLMSHRGSAGEPIEAQFNMGNAIGDLLTSVEMPHAVVESAADLPEVDRLVAHAFTQREPVGLLFPFAFWSSKAN